MARVKASQIEAARLAEWEALLLGNNDDARRHYEAARSVAETRGFNYQPMNRLIDGDLEKLIDRLTSLADRAGNLVESDAVTVAVLGAATETLPSIRTVLDEYIRLTETQHQKKSEAQKMRWRQKRERAINHFLDVINPKPNGNGSKFDPPIDSIKRKDALKFRDWWAAKVKGGMKIDTANKDIGHLSEIFSTWTELTATDLTNPFEKLRLEGKDESNTPAFSKDWITSRLLPRAKMSGLNNEARDIFLVMVNTGLRPSEITDAPVEDFCLDQNVPFLRVAPHGRELKVLHTRRDIPLLGISLEAARRIKNRGGIRRYHHKASACSAVFNKFLRDKNLKESPRHVAYSIRHYMENALLAARVDDRVRADILGHKYARPAYGDGGGQEGRREALTLIAIIDSGDRPTGRLVAIIRALSTAILCPSISARRRSKSRKMGTDRTPSRATICAAIEREFSRRARSITTGSP